MQDFVVLILLANIPFLKYMIVFLTVTFVQIFLQDGDDLLNQRTYFPLSFYQTLRRTSYFHLLYHASPPGKSKTGQ